MKPRWRFCGAVTTMYCGVLLACNAGSGYLAEVGPAQFRFQKPVAPRPLQANNPVALSPALPSAVTNTTPIFPVAISTNLNPPAPQPGQTITNEPVEPSYTPPPDDVISPQMLLKYFVRSTNGTGTSVIAPLTVPGRPAEPASSHATYSN